MNRDRPAVSGPASAWGSPRFADPRLATIAAADGAAAAWREALRAGDAAAAAQGVTGDFALVAQRDDGSIVCAVDRFAVRTLCWRVAGGRLEVAPRADALAGPAPALDVQAIHDYLHFHVVPAPRTVHAGVQRLPAGHLLEFRDGRAEVRPYWRPRFAARRDVAFAPLAAEFRALLRTAVAAELGHGKPACFLSGGTDSSTVAGMIRDASGERPATYSIGFDAEGYDEMAYARIAARHFDTEHHEYYLSPADLVRGIPVVAAAYDQPFGNSSALPAYCCARIAAGDGVAKLLAGDGGDELFGGNARYAKQRVFEAYARVPAALRRALVEPLAGATRGLPLLGKGFSYVEQARTPLPARMDSYNLLGRLGIERVLTAAFRERIDLADAQAQQQRVWDAIDADDATNRQLAFDWRYTLAEADLPKVVGTTALAGIEVGFPMLAQPLVDFSLALPVSYKLRGMKLRWFFKEALRGFLPDAIIAKRKQGFGLPFGVWALADAALGALAHDALGSFATRGIVEPTFIGALESTLLREHPGYYGEMVWILVMLEHWLRAHAPDFRID